MLVLLFGIYCQLEAHIRTVYVYIYLAVSPQDCVQDITSAAWVVQIQNSRILKHATLITATLIPPLGSGTETSIEYGRA